MARSNSYPELAITLDDYAERLGIECAPFNGFKVTGSTDYFCNYIWSQTQREYLAMALKTAQELIEEQLGYPIAARYFNEEQMFAHYTARGVEIPAPLQLAQGMGIEFGIAMESEIEAGAVIVYGTDAGVVTVTVAEDVPLSEVKVFYPDEYVTTDAEFHKYEITPSLFERSGTTVTITIPRCRLMKVSLFYSSETLRYEDAANYMTTVNVARVYTDTTDIATVYYDSQCADGACDQGSQTACAEWRDKRNGLIRLTLANYDDDTAQWERVRGCRCQTPRYALINYRAGLANVSATLAQAVIRLAHTLLPKEPCGCEGVVNIWEQDRGEAAVVSSVQNNPWGLTAGAYFAWGVTQQMRLGHGGLL